MSGGGPRFPPRGNMNQSPDMGNKHGGKQGGPGRGGGGGGNMGSKYADAVKNAVNPASVWGQPKSRNNNRE